MRLSNPRVLPLGDEEFTDEIWRSTGLADDCYRLNIIRTLARRPVAMVKFLGWAGHIMSADNSLPPRERELVTLRIGHLCRAGYELAQHTRIGLAAGLLPEEIDRVGAGAEMGWSAADAALIRACDELVADHFVSDAVWTQLLAHFGEQQAMDAVMTAGQYVQVSMMLNTFGVQLEPGMDPTIPWNANGGFSNESA